jgi:hypothetical protein
MIGRVHKRGKRVAGLIWYLYGPGKQEEHVNPRIIAAWDGDPAGLEPQMTARGHRDYRRLIRLLEQPLAAAGLTNVEKTVWHTSLRNDATDRILSDGDWAKIAQQALNDVGIAQFRDDDAVRWIAVRHGDDHIHIVATLARQDGHVEYGFRDYPRLRESCMALEKRYGLQSTAPADKTATPTPGPHEVGKAHRHGRNESYRDKLRRDVRTAAAAADNSSDFWERLRDSGVLIRHRYSVNDPAQITGYAVGLPGHKTSDGNTVWYGGGRLAPDLTLPKLRARWGEPSSRPAPSTRPRFSPDERADAYDTAAEAVREAAEQIRRDAAADPASAASTAQAAADVLTSAGRATDGPNGGPLWEAADLLDRAIRSPYGRVLPRTATADSLRSMARLLSLAGRISGNNDALAAARLVVNLAALAESVADLRTAQQLAHQAAAAQRAATQLKAAANSALAALDTPTQARTQSTTQEHRRSR